MHSTLRQTEDWVRWSDNPLGRSEGKSGPEGPALPSFAKGDFDFFCFFKVQQLPAPTHTQTYTRQYVIPVGGMEL